MGRVIGECTHKVAADFIVGRGDNNRAIWKCSGCGLVGSWQDDWAYYGNIECRRCQAQAIDDVYCGRCAPGAMLVARAP